MLARQESNATPHQAVDLTGAAKRAVADLKKSAGAQEATGRTQRDLSSKVVFGGLGVVFLCMVALYFYFAGAIGPAAVAAIVMIILGFFFAAVSGNLVGMIGSSNNPISGLTLCTVVISALLMVAMGVGAGLMVVGLNRIAGGANGV